MILEKELSKKLQTILHQVFQLNVSSQEASKWIQPTRPEFEGTHTITCFPIAKLAGKNPETVAAAIGEALLAEGTPFSGFHVVKGFLNLSLRTEQLIMAFNNLNLAPENPTGVRCMVEFSSPNTNKPLHLGHLRNNFLGDSISRILAYVGYEVIKANLVNDRGIHICKSMLAYQKSGAHETPQTSGLKGDKLVGKYYVLFDQLLKQNAQELKAAGWDDEKIEKENPLLLEAQAMLRKWEEGDPEVLQLWKTMNAWVYEGFDETYAKIGITFDKIYYESDTYLLGKAVVEEGLAKGVFYKKPDGSVWIDLTDVGLDHKLVLRSDGTSVYITQDLGTADLKYKDYHMQKSIYVVGNEQDYHFNVLKNILLQLKRPYAAGIYHMSYGMVDLPTGKMKSREGTVVDADDLIAEMVKTAAETTQQLGKIEGMSAEEAANLFHMLGVGALKYFLLKVDPKKRLLFNPAESIDFHGHTGPFIQYTYARIQSLLRKASEKQLQISDTLASSDITVLDPSEKALIWQLIHFKETVHMAANTYSPALVANYLYELAKFYNSFYAAVTVLNEPDVSLKALRLTLSKQTAQTIKVGMELLGIRVPERM